MVYASLVICTDWGESKFVSELFIWQCRVLWTAAEVSQPQGACPRGDKLSFGTETSQKRAQSWVFSAWKSVKWSRTCPCNAAEALLLGWPSPAQRRVVDTVDQTQPSWESERRLKSFCVVGECLDIFRANWTDTSHNTFSFLLVKYFITDAQSLPVCVSKYLSKEGAKLEVKTAL